MQPNDTVQRPPSEVMAPVIDKFSDRSETTSVSKLAEALRKANDRVVESIEEFNSAETERDSDIKSTILQPLLMKMTKFIDFLTSSDLQKAEEKREMMTLLDKIANKETDVQVELPEEKKKGGLWGMLLAPIAFLAGMVTSFGRSIEAIKTA